MGQNLSSQFLHSSERKLKKGSQYFQMNRSLLLLLASLLFSVLSLFYLYKTSPREIKMKTVYPPFKNRKEEKTIDIIQQSQTLEDKFSENMKFQDLNQDLVLKLKLQNKKYGKTCIQVYLFSNVASKPPETEVNTTCLPVELIPAAQLTCNGREA